MSTTRLNKHLALALGISRRQADELIADGKVTVSGEVAKLGRQFEGSEAITVEGKSLPHSSTAPYLYILLDKPVGYVCSRRQQGSTPTIYGLLPQKYQHLKPAGRLDKDTSGLLLLTNDGDLAHRLTHPSFHKTKEYTVTLGAPLQPLHHQMIADIGVDLPDGKSKLQLERLSDNGTTWRVLMHEGRNRQIRRTFAALGYNVVALRRLSFGPFSLAQLAAKPLIEIAPPQA